MARQIKDVTVEEYFIKWWSAKKTEVHNAWWNDRAKLLHIEKLSNGHFRLTLTDGSVKVVEPSVELWLETY